MSTTAQFKVNQKLKTFVGHAWSWPSRPSTYYTMVKNSSKQSNFSSNKLKKLVKWQCLHFVINHHAMVWQDFEPSNFDLKIPTCIIELFGEIYAIVYYMQRTRQGAWAVLEPPKGCPLTPICGIRQYEIAAKMCKNEESLIFVHTWVCLFTKQPSLLPLPKAEFEDSNNSFSRWWWTTDESRHLLLNIVLAFMTFISKGYLFHNIVIQEDDLGQYCW
jgi:hypothetical protein